MQINPQTKITLLDSEFVSVLNERLQDTSPDAKDVIALNYRDPQYSSDSGGYHPVEIHVGPDEGIQCITYFTCFGMPPFFLPLTEILFV
jgi:hypothetical protein